MDKKKEDEPLRKEDVWVEEQTNGVFMFNCIVCKQDKRLETDRGISLEESGKARKVICSICAQEIKNKLGLTGALERLTALEKAMPKKTIRIKLDDKTKERFDKVRVEAERRTGTKFDDNAVIELLMNIAKEKQK